MPTPTHASPLSSLKSGCLAKIFTIEGQAGFLQRMAMLGIRRGELIRVLHGPGSRGAVIGIGGARIALGREILEYIHVEPLSDLLEGQAQ